MSTEPERDYVSLIPVAPPADLYSWLQHQEGKFRQELLVYRFLPDAEARAAAETEGCAADLRPGLYSKTALVWCSGCERAMLAEYIQARACHGTAVSGGIRWVTPAGRAEDVPDGQSLLCPLCGAEVRLQSVSGMRYGRTDQVCALVVTAAGGCAVMTMYCVERHIHALPMGGKSEVQIQPMSAILFDGKKVRKLVHMRRFFYGYYELPGWERQKRFSDTTGPAYCYPLPDLGGTCLENAKLDEYYRQAYEKGVFWPVSYARLYQKHPNVENLITAGLGALLGKAIQEESGEIGMYRNCYAVPRLPWIDWKQARPAKMLHMTRDQLRTVRQEGWTVQELTLWQKLDSLPFADYAAARRLLGPGNASQSIQSIQSILADGRPLLRTARYLARQKESYHTLSDYWRMAAALGRDLDEPTVRWPRDLHEAHESARREQKYRFDQDQQQAFAAMTARCRGLNWEQDGICIRVAESPAELVAEGNTLHHCVGGYAKAHAQGRIILFIRHTRRPERSWYTLNVDVHTKEILQNHGYRNERLPDGTRLRIPRQVAQFVARWQETVLARWRLPPAPEQRKAKRKKAAGDGRAA